MNIYFDLESIEVPSKPTSVALGTFDGLHIGHMEVINRMKQVAKQEDLATFVYTFSNHPKAFLKPEDAPAKIMDIDEKVQIFTRAEIDYLALLSFDAFQMNLEPEVFIEDILVKRLNMKHLTVGYDYRFGKGVRGNTDMLMAFSETYGYTCSVIEPIMRNNQRVSSSLIRQLLAEGKIEEANFYLGRSHFIKGVVVRGKGKGKALEVPTANLRLKDNISTVKPGVYITETLFQATYYPSVTNVGYNPTFDQVGLHMETYIFGIDRALYDETIEVHFLKRLRDELKFTSELELKAAMKKDLDDTRAYFRMTD